MAGIKDDLMNFIIENFIAGRSDAVITPDTLLIDEKIIDSTGVLELVTYIEEKYSITIEDEELIPENLNSISFITEFLKTKGVN